MLVTTLPQIANPSGIAHGVALLVAWLVLTFYYVKGATFYIVTVSRLGGLGHQFFFFSSGWGISLSRSRASALPREQYP